jgi:predicted MPP superfamily phosphohydrolase/energy-coupling factor transporter ATP-binding protein EcfA2
MENLTILHLSDLHFEPGQRKDIRIVRDALFADLASLKSSLGLEPSIVIFSGDFVFAGDLGYGDDRNDYDSVLKEFINPLLQSIELDTDDLFVCAGNHDVQRSKVDEIIEEGLRQKLTNEQAVSSVLDNIDRHKYIVDRLSNFERFRVSLPNRHLRKSNELFATYKITRFNKVIGIACLNSAWRASGGGDETDYGKLLIGERALDSCIEDLADCDLRIGVVHHPFSYLQAYERIEMQRRAFNAFNVWLHGHIHEQDYQLAQTLNESRVIAIAGGAVYYRRGYYNGYSIIQYSLNENTGRIYLREYFDRVRRFTESALQEGTVSFTLSSTGIGPLSGNLSLIAQIRPGVHELVNKHLLSAATLQSRAPKELEKIFVEPPLSTVSEHKQKSWELNQRKRIPTKSLDELLSSEKNLLFIGKRESGKTTLLNHICASYVEPNTLKQVRIPLLINHKKLPAGKDKIKKAILDYIYELQITPDMEQQLQQGNCVILVDDLDVNNGKSLSALRQFARDHSQNRYIFTVDEEIFADLDFDDTLPDLGIEYERIYIHSFGKKQIRGLISKWFQNVPIGENEEELDNIADRVLAIDVPRTPLLVSLLLLIVEQQPDYVPINQASLLEKLIEVLLGKMNPAEEVRREELDFRNKEDFLCYIAYQLVRKNSYQLEVQEFRREASHYFEQRGLTVSRSGGIEGFTSRLLERGVLVGDRGNVYFRFRCFREFFTAKCMMENRNFYNEVLTDDKFADFANEIDYLTGLQRKNRDIVEFLNEVVRRSLKDFLSDIGLEVELGLFDNITIHKSAIDSLPEEKHDLIIQNLRKLRVGLRDLDETMELSTPPAVEGEPTLDKVQQDADIANDKLARLVESLMLFARVIRNCELIDDRDFKKANVRLCVESFLKMLYVSMVKSDEMFKELDEEEVAKRLKEAIDIMGLDTGVEEIAESGHMKENLSYFTRILQPLLFETLICDLLGTPKLEIAFGEEIDKPDNHILLRLVYTLIYRDLKLEGYIDRLERLVNEVHKNEYYRELIYQSLSGYYLFRELSANERRRIESIIADLIATRTDSPQRGKAEIIGKIRRIH